MTDEEREEESRRDAEWEQNCGKNMWVAFAGLPKAVIQEIRLRVAVAYPDDEPRKHFQRCEAVANLYWRTEPPK